MADLPIRLHLPEHILLLTLAQPHAHCQDPAGPAVGKMGLDDRHIHTFQDPRHSSQGVHMPLA